MRIPGDSHLCPTSLHCDRLRNARRPHIHPRQRTPCKRSPVALVPTSSSTAPRAPRAAWAQDKPKATGLADAPGKETLLAKCFQCHSAGMGMDHRQDRRGWESVLYRMVGRGALWSEEEIKAMADYLGTVYARRPQ